MRDPRERLREQLRLAKSKAGATVGWEARLWRMADALRGSMDAAEYKPVVLGGAWMHGSGRI